MENTATIKDAVEKPVSVGSPKHFTPRELQFSISILVVAALIGGILLQTVSYSLMSLAGLGVVSASVILVSGYVLLVSTLSVSFSHKLMGPFKRLEYEMKLIADGESGRRLSVRTNDGLAVVSFVKNANRMIGVFDERSAEYKRIAGALSARVNAVNEELSKKDIDPVLAKLEISALQRQLDELRKKW